MSDNSKLWRSVETTDAAYMKEVNKGAYKFKAIDAHYQLLQATKLWGPYGSTWGIRNEVFTPIMTGANDIAAMIYTATLYYPDGDFPINSDIRLNTYVKSSSTWKVNGDFAKKVSTDALTKGLSKLGFSADVFMGAFDGNKYDGIDSYDIDFLASDEQLETLKGYLKTLKEKEKFDNAEWLDKQITGDLKSERADKVISRVKTLLEEK